jgi:hypothetical protein
MGRNRVQRGRCVRLTSPPSVSRMSRQSGFFEPPNTFFLVITSQDLGIGGWLTSGMIREIRCRSGDWIQLVCDRIQCQTLINTPNVQRISKSSEWRNIFSKQLLLRGWHCLSSYTDLGHYEGICIRHARNSVAWIYWSAKYSLSITIILTYHTKRLHLKQVSILCTNFIKFQ